MNTLEIQIVGLKEQCMAAFAEDEDAIRRIAEHGPCGDEYDMSLCRMMAHSIVGDIAMSRHNAKVEADNG